MRILIVSMAALGLVLGSLVPAGATAQQVQYKKKTEYDFEEDTISGDLTTPDGEFVESRRRIRHANLIRIRENFHREILQSVGEL